MEKIKIKRHNFDLSKNRIKEFSEKAEAELKIDTVKTDGGFFGLLDHKVTGYELNTRIESIQGHLIDTNTTNNRIIKEFKEVYNALDSLDKEYITSIIATIKAIEKTSNDVKTQQGILKKHNEKLVNQQNKLNSHQVEIKKNVANVTKMVTVLKSFKEKLDSYKHLTDIDKIWSDCKKIRNEIQVFSDSITVLSEDRIKAKEYANTNRDLIIELQEFKKQVDSIKHLVDVDFIWERANVLNEGLEDAKKSLEDTNKSLEDTKKDLENTNKGLEDTNDSVTSLQQKTVEIDNEIADKTKKMKDSMVSLEKKLKYAYFIAGGALGLAVVELLLILTGVI